MEQREVADRGPSADEGEDVAEGGNPTSDRMAAGARDGEGPSVRQIEDQINYELGCIEAGKRRYWSNLNDNAFAESRPGQTALVEILGTPVKMIPKAGSDLRKGLIYAIWEAQNEALAEIEGGVMNRWASRRYIINLLDADKLALIAARSMLNSGWRTDQSGRSLTALARDVVKAIRNEVEYEMWQSKSAGEELDLARIMIAKTGIVDTRTYERWRKKLAGQIERVDTSDPDWLSVAAALVHMGVVNGGGWFELRQFVSQGKTIRRLFLTPEAFAALADINSNLEVSRPVRLPMICKPKPWRRT